MPRLPRTFGLGRCAALLVLAGCATASSQQTAPTNLPAILPLAESHSAGPDDTATIGITLSRVKPAATKHYGQVFGYFLGTKGKKSQVITLSPNEPVVFENVDGTQHSASYLGDATKKSAPWPSSFDGQLQASTPGTAIGTDGFSTGTLRSGQSSATFSAGAPGFYMLGCYFHYTSAGHRTVIIVK